MSMTTRELLLGAAGHALRAEMVLESIPHNDQSADVRHARIKLAAARRGLTDALAKLKEPKD